MSSETRTIKYCDINNDHIDQIKNLFHKRYSYKSILQIISDRYKVILSLKNLAKILKCNGLRRKNINESSLRDLVMAIVWI